MTQAEKEQDNGKEKEKERDKDKEKEQQRGVKRPIAPPTIPEPLQEVRGGLRLSSVHCCHYLFSCWLRKVLLKRFTSYPK